MTKKDEWRMAKWIKRNGATERCNLPEWFDISQGNMFNYFYIKHITRDPNGYPVISPGDIVEMQDKHLDAFHEEKARKTHEFRDWIEPTGIILSLVLSIIALVVSIVK